MFERKISSVDGMNETVTYSITFTGEYVKQHPTIEEFVYYVLNHNKDEWGTFRIEVEDTSNRKQVVYMKYKFGKFEDPPACYFACLSEYGKLRIESVKASGIHKLVDYNIEYEIPDTKQLDVKHPDIPQEWDTFLSIVKEIDDAILEDNEIDNKQTFKLIDSVINLVKLGYKGEMTLQLQRSFILIDLYALQHFYDHGFTVGVLYTLRSIIPYIFKESE